MTELILIASGGALGALSRFLLSNFVKIFFNNSLYGTFCINILGSFFIGYLISLGYAKNISENLIKYFLIIGFLGSFTTFSAFSIESVSLIESNKYSLLIIYVSSSIFFCISAAYIGMSLNKFWLSLLLFQKMLIQD